MSNYHSNYHDPVRQYSSASYTTNTDKTLFLTPYNQSIVSRSSASQDKSEKPERGSSKTKLTPDILRAITKIDNLSQIVEINLDGNSRHLKSRLKAISGLHSLMNLRELILSNNDIEKIENLNHLKNLHILNLSFNKITKIENISILKQLQVLDLSNNLIEEIPALISKNINLVDLNLANNLLSDKASIMNLKPLPKLTILDLTNNPIREIPGYPTFIYHLLKKLCKLDSKMTPNFSKAQANNYLTQTSKYSSLGGLPNELSKNSQEEEEEVPPEPEHDENEENEIKISYEQRLLATQNRLNELNVLSSRVRLLSAEDINSNKYFKAPQRDTANENNKSAEQKNSTFLVNENTLYSVSESAQDTRLKSNPMGEDTLDMHVNSYKDTTGILGNVSANMKLLDIPSPHGQTQGTVEGWNFSVQTPPPNSGMHRGGFFGQGGENKMENTLRPSGIMTNLIRLSRGGLEDTNEQQQQQQPSTVKKGQGQGGRAPETGEIAERIQGLQGEIEQRIANYDRITNTFTTKRQDVLERVKSLDEVMQNILLSTGGMKMNNNSGNISPLLNEQTEMLSHVRDVLDLLEYQSENHMNYLLMLNHIHSKLEGEGSKGIKSQAHEEALTVEDIDLTFTVLSQRIDEISSRLETLYTHIYRIISKFNNSNTPKKFSRPSPKNSLFSNIEAQFKDLSIQVDSLIKEEQVRTKTFTGLRGLYTNMWRLTKSLVQIWKQEATLDMESHLIGKTSFADFLFTSPKEPQVDNFTSPQHVGDFAADSTVKADKENWGLASPDPVMAFGGSQGQDHHHHRGSSINDRALRNLNTEESDRASSKAGKLTPVSDILRGQNQLGSKSPISQNQNYQNRTSRTEFSARENIRSARDNKSLTYEKGGLMRNSSKFNDDFAFPTISDHGENASPKDGSFSRNVSGINRRESGHTNDILRGFSYLSSHRGTLQNEGNNKPEKPCVNCAAKDSAVKFAQDEMLKAQRDKLTLEMELGRLRAEIIGIQKAAEHEIARARSESIQLASIQDREKEEYSTALILLSEICNHNSTKLDEIRLKMLSMMEQNVADSSNPLKWLVKMQSSTVEDLIKANNEMQDRTKSILTDFQTLFKEKTPRNDSLYAIKDNFQLTQQSTRRDDSHSKIPETALPTQEEPVLQSTREIPVFKVDPIEIPKAFEPQEHQEENNIFEQNPTPTLNAIQIENDNPDRDSFRPRLEAPMLQKLKKHNSETDLRRVSSAAKENSIEGSLYQPVRAFHEIKEQRNNKPKQASSFHMDQASLFPQFTLDMKPEILANGQITFNKNSVRESENNSLGNTNLNQILFGCNATETISELSRPIENPSNIHLPSESDLNAFQSSVKDSTPTTLTGGFSPFQSYKFMQYAKISGNTLSNLQENIAQHLIKNEKGDAGKHLKKINNHLHQYKGMRERVAEVIGRRSIKPSESAKKKSRAAGTSTPVNQSASKYSSPSIASNRRATLDVKTPRGVEQQPKEYASVRHNVGVNRGQFKYNNVFRKPSNYPTTTGERGVNVNLKNFLSEGKRVLESPDVTNYHEKFDIGSPYHPVYSSHGSQGMRVSDSAVGSQVNSVGRMSLGMHPVERNMHL